MFGLFKNKKISQEEEAKFFKAFFKRIINEDRARNGLSHSNDDFSLMIDFVANEVINAGASGWKKSNIFSEADDLELCIMTYHVWYLFNVICSKTGIDRRQRSEFYKSAVASFFEVIEENRKAFYPSADLPSELDPERFAKDLEMLILRADKIYGPEKIWETFENTLYKCLSDLESGSKEVTGRRSLELMMTQLKERLAAYDLH